MRSSTVANDVVVKTKLSAMATRSTRHLVLVLGDQLDLESSAFDEFDPTLDAVWMAEVEQESTKVWTGKPRIVMFLSAMRHFCAALRSRSWPVYYRELDSDGALWRGADGRSLASVGDGFDDVLRESLARIQPQKVLLVEPGEWQVKQDIVKCLRDNEVQFELRADRHFLCSHEEFSRHAKGRKQLRMEYFYREMRIKHRVLLVPQQAYKKASDKPEGGSWNFDRENRKSFSSAGPPLHPAPISFAPDAITQSVIAMVNSRFANHPGELAEFNWPVTALDAQLALEDFIQNRLAAFGDWQDAMWIDQPWLFHSRLSAAMNLKILNPRQVINAAENAWRKGQAPLPAVEGFIRQILGWREYVRGIYWHNMPNYIQHNALAATQALPHFYWTANTEMRCMKSALDQSLRLGYAHHIQRLMVTGLFALMFGANPAQVHAWYLAVYVDAVEWVELPNTLGMSQYADGGLMSSKPYVASGKYIQRMSNYCASCRFNPSESTGPTACPFTTLYWDFLIRHKTSLSQNPRMLMQLKNLERLDEETRSSIQEKAQLFREETAISKT